MKPIALRYDDDVRPSDVESVRRIVSATEFFRADETEIAVELIQERLHRGIASGYEFILADLDNQVVGYTCFGEIACTRGSFDLYWIAVDPSCQRQGIGRQLLIAAERRIRERDGRAIYIETSNRPLYAPTRIFYEGQGYGVVAILPDFYDIGDDKVVLCKSLTSMANGFANGSDALSEIVRRGPGHE